MNKELELLRKIAKEAKALWDKGRFQREDMYIKGLLTDYIDLKEREGK